MRAVAALDWEATVTRAEHEGLAPILYVAVRGGGAPAPVLARLRSAWLDSERRRLLATSQLREIIAAFGRAGLSAIVVNGPALAAACYPDPALRPFTHLTLVIRRGDRARARDVLATLGDGPGRSESSRLPVDLRWECVRHLGGGRLTDVVSEEIWSRSVPAGEWGDGARTLAPEDLVVHLATEVAALGLGGGLAELDLALVLERHGATLDWDAIGARARRWRAAAAVYFALRAVADRLGITAPSPTVHRLYPGELRVALMDRLQQAGPAPAARREWLIRLVMLDRASDAVRALAAELLGPDGAVRWRTLLAAYLKHVARALAAAARTISMPGPRGRVGAR